MLDPGWDGRCSTVLLLFISDQSTTEITESTENSLASCFPISAFFVSLRFNPWMWQRLAEVSACGSAALRSRSMPLAKSVPHIVRLRLIEDQRDGVSS